MLFWKDCLSDSSLINMSYFYLGFLDWKKSCEIDPQTLMSKRPNRSESLDLNSNTKIKIFSIVFLSQKQSAFLWNYLFNCYLCKILRLHKKTRVFIFLYCIKILTKKKYKKIIALDVELKSASKRIKTFCIIYS